MYQNYNKQNRCFWDTRTKGASKRTRPAKALESSLVANSFKQRIEWLVPDLFGIRRKKRFPYLQFVQVLGTNGKGSFCNELYRQLRADITTIYTFTSPHLLDLRERFLLNGKPLPRQRFFAWQELYGDYFPQFFEKILAFSLYEIAYGGDFDPNQSVVVILEAGIGGRFDATSAIEIDIAVLLEVGADHQEMLGYRHYERVREKTMGISPCTKEIFCVKPHGFRLSWDSQLWGSDGAGLSCEKVKDAPCVEVLREVESHVYAKGYDELTRSFVRNWSGLIGAKLSFLSLKPGKKGLEKAVKSVYSALLRDLSRNKQKLEPKPAIVLTGRQQQVSGLENTIFDVAHNTSALSYLISSLQKRKDEAKARKVWLVLSLEKSRLQHIDWIEVFSFFTHVIGVEIPGYGVGALDVMEPVLVDAATTISMQDYLQECFLDRSKQSNTRKLATSGMLYQSAIFDMTTKKISLEELGDQCSLTQFLKHMDTQACEEGGLVAVVGSFTWMQEVFNLVRKY